MTQIIRNIFIYLRKIRFINKFRNSYINIIFLKFRIFFSKNKSQKFRFEKNISLVKFRRNLCYYDYRKAYSQRIAYCLKILRTSKSTEMISKTSNYLRAIVDTEVFEYFGQNKADINFIESYLKENPKDLVCEPCIKKKSIGKVLLLGPGIDLSEINNQDFDLLVLNKPVDSSEFCMPSKSMLIIPNNTWCLYKKEELLDFLNSHSNASMIAPITINNTWTKSSAFLSIPQYIFGSLQGLQRILIILSQEFIPQSITIKGFNFFLDKKAYKDWYPSLLEEEYGSKRLGIYIASINHDYLLNISFAKKYLAKFNISIDGDLNPYLQLSTLHLLDNFFNIYSNQKPINLDTLNMLHFAKYRRPCTSN